MAPDAAQWRVRGRGAGPESTNSGVSWPPPGRTDVGLGLLDRDCDSAALVAGFDEPVRVDDVVQWVGCPEDRGEGAGFDEGRELLQASGAQFQVAVVDGDVLAVGGQGFPAGLLEWRGLQSADAVQDQVVARPLGWGVDAGVVQYLVGSEGSDEVEVLRAADGGYACSQGLGVLDGQRSRGSRCAVDEDVLSGSDCAAVDLLECEQPAVGGSGRLLVGEVGGLERQGAVGA